MILGMGALWVLAPLAAAIAAGRISDDYPSNPRMAMWSAASALVLALLVYLVRGVLLQSRIDRGLAYMMCTALLSQALLSVGAELGGLAPVLPQTFQFFYWAGIVGVVAFTLESRLTPTALAYLAGFFVVAIAPELRLFVMAGTNLVLLGNVLIIWLPARA
ncbi:hypothetical protein [Haliangium ochraceum]|nr:hypothetical protein [Haliangium ochraceum]